MYQSQRLSSAIPPAAFGLPVRSAQMMLASIETARPSVGLHTFECAACNHVLTALAAFEDPMKSKGPWILASKQFVRADVMPLS